MESYTTGSSQSPLDNETRSVVIGCLVVTFIAVLGIFALLFIKRPYWCNRCRLYHNAPSPANQNERSTHVYDNEVFVEDVASSEGDYSGIDPTNHLEGDYLPMNRKGEESAYVEASFVNEETSLGAVEGNPYEEVCVGRQLQPAKSTRPILPPRQSVGRLEEEAAEVDDLCEDSNSQSFAAEQVVIGYPENSESGVMSQERQRASQTRPDHDNVPGLSQWEQTDTPCTNVDIGQEFTHEIISELHSRGSVFVNEDLLIHQNVSDMVHTSEGQEKMQLEERVDSFAGTNGTPLEISAISSKLNGSSKTEVVQGECGGFETVLKMTSSVGAEHDSSEDSDTISMPLQTEDLQDDPMELEESSPSSGNAENKFEPRPSFCQLSGFRPIPAKRKHPSGNVKSVEFDEQDSLPSGARRNSGSLKDTADGSFLGDENEQYGNDCSFSSHMENRGYPHIEFGDSEYGGQQEHLESLQIELNTSSYSPGKIQQEDSEDMVLYLNQSSSVTGQDQSSEELETQFNRSTTSGDLQGSSLDSETDLYKSSSVTGQNQSSEELETQFNRSTTSGDLQGSSPDSETDVYKSSSWPDRELEFSIAEIGQEEYEDPGTEPNSPFQTEIPQDVSRDAKTTEFSVFSPAEGSEKISTDSFQAEVEQEGSENAINGNLTVHLMVCEGGSLDVGAEAKTVYSVAEVQREGYEDVEIETARHSAAKAQQEDPGKLPTIMNCHPTAEVQVGASNESQTETTLATTSLVDAKEEGPEELVDVLSFLIQVEHLSDSSEDTEAVRDGSSTAEVQQDRPGDFETVRNGSSPAEVQQDESGDFETVRNGSSIPEVQQDGSGGFETALNGPSIAEVQQGELGLSGIVLNMTSGGAELESSEEEDIYT